MKDHEWVSRLLVVLTVTLFISIAAGPVAAQGPFWTYLPLVLRGGGEVVPPTATPTLISTATSTKTPTPTSTPIPAVPTATPVPTPTAAPVPGMVGGMVWYDVNQNGEYEQNDSAEFGLSGITIHLIGQGIWRTAVTDSGGIFIFYNVAPGAYRIEEEDLAGYTSTTPDGAEVVIYEGGAALVWFGDIGNATITGVVWWDFDQDWIRDDWEPGIEGVFVVATSYDGDFWIFIKTNSDGVYWLPVIADNYVVEEIDPDYYVSVTPNEVEGGVDPYGTWEVNFGDY